MKLLFILFVHVYLFVFSAGERCQTLDGLWYNEYGSQLRLSHTKDGILLGSFTAAERELGIDSRSTLQSDVTGAAAYNRTGAVFSLSAMWMNDASVKSWIGQCLICGSDEVLETSWLVRRKVGVCSDKWLMTNTGQTVFRRLLARNDSKTPVNSQSYSADGKRKRKRSILPIDVTTTRPLRTCSLDGYWYNELGSELFIAYHQNMTIIGEYRTAVELSKGSAGPKHSIVYGMANAFDTNTTIALHVIWNNGTSVTGWVGQCHVCGPNQTETLVTTWLLRSWVNSCDENWSATRIGENYFTRQEQKAGPRKRLGTDTPSMAQTG